MLLTPEVKKERWEKAYAGEREFFIPKNLWRAKQGLFWEYRHACRCKERGYSPLFNLSLRDHDDTLSFPNMYFQCDSEYEFAMVVLGHWAHWEKLASAEWFSPYLTKWREEKKRRDIAYGRSRIRELAAKGNLSACKLIASGGLEEKYEEVTPPKKAKGEVAEIEQDSALDAFLQHGASILGDAE